jgi:stage II sporulation protein M
LKDRGARSERLLEQSQPVTDASQSKHVQRRLWPYILLAAVLFLIPLVSGLFVSPEFASGALEELELTLKPLVESLNPLVLLIIIFINNAIKALAALVLGIVLGLPSLLFLVANGFMIGLTVMALKSSLGCGVIAASLTPHGIIEIPALVLSSALGLRIGWESLKYLTKQKSCVKAQLRQGIRVYFKWMLVSLFFAATIEVFITPLFILLAGGKDLFVK